MIATVLNEIPRKEMTQGSRIRVRDDTISEKLFSESKIHGLHSTTCGMGNPSCELLLASYVSQQVTLSDSSP